MNQVEYQLARGALLQSQLVDAIRAVDDAGGFVYANEYDLQSALAEVFAAAGITALREVILPDGKRIDFVAPLDDGDELIAGLAVGIEVKIRGSFKGVYRQLRGYADEDLLTGLVLVTTRSALHGTMPPFFHSFRVDDEQLRVPAHIPLAVVGLTGAAL